MQLTFPQYQAIDALNASAIKQLLKSPLHYKEEYVVDKEKEAPSDALQLGTALHARVLEPTKKNAYFVIPKCDRRTKEGKATYARFQQSLPKDDEGNPQEDLCIITHKQDLQVERMNKALMDHPAADYLLQPKPFGEYHVESTIVWRQDGLASKCRPDLLTFESDEITKDTRMQIIDLKSTGDASMDGFQRAVAKYGYHIQAAYYLEALQHEFPVKYENLNFYFIAVEKTSPYAVGVYELDELALAQGRREIRRATEIYKEIYKNPKHPKFTHYNDNQPMSLHLPRYSQDSVYSSQLYKQENS